MITLLSAKSTPTSLLIERWLLYVQHFHYVVAGKENLGDASSWLPLDQAEDQDAETMEYAFSIASEVVLAVLTAVEQASEQDPTLQLVYEAVTSGH